jgi:hypothetical protein
VYRHRVAKTDIRESLTRTPEAYGELVSSRGAVLCRVARSHYSAISIRSPFHFVHGRFHSSRKRANQRRVGARRMRSIAEFGT